MIGFDAATMPMVPVYRLLEERQQLPSVEGPGVSAGNAEGWLSSLTEKFGRVAQLDSGWAGPHSLKPDKSKLYYAREIVKAALAGINQPALPFVVPLEDGGVQIEWHRAGATLEIAFFASGEISALFEDKQGGGESEAEGVAAIDLLMRNARRVAAPLHNATDVPVAAATPVLAFAA